MEEPVARSPVASAGGGDGEVQHGAPAHLQRIARYLASAGPRPKQPFVETSTEEPVARYLTSAGLRTKQLLRAGCSTDNGC